MRSKNLPGRRDPPASATALPASEETARLGPVLGQILDALDEIRDRLAGAHKPVLTIEEVARLVGRAPFTVRRWVKEGRIRASRVSGSGPRGRLLVGHDEVRKLIDAGLGGEVPAALGG
jgi:excisionase family DNA binding protein